MTTELDNVDWIDGEGQVINDSPVPSSEIALALLQQHPGLDRIARVIGSHVGSWGGGTGGTRAGGLFERDRYTTPHKITDQMKVAAYAAERDDIVAGVIETTESLAFSRVSFECEDEDLEDVYNQIAQDLDLDARLREMWRELFTVSNMYVAMLWGSKTYKPRNNSGARARRKSYKVNVPTALSILDPLRVVPVGSFLFGKEKLAYLADRYEATEFDNVLAGKNSTDLVVAQLLTGRYEPSRSEKQRLQEDGFEVDNLFLLNPKSVWRHTLTRPAYERFADVRMTSIFELLDMKQQLRGADRSALLGATNFIVLIRIGTDDRPAAAQEIAGLSASVRTASRVPVIVGDHRLSIDIITPNTDTTLRPERYNTLDARITARLYDIMMLGAYSAGGKGDDSIKLSRVVGRAMESRRHMLRRALEKNVFKPMYEKNSELTSEARLMFHPNRIALDFDPAVAQMIMDLRDRGDLSRQTTLSELDFSQRDEAMKREREAEKYDDIFQTATPHDSPDNNSFQPGEDPKTGGRNGGGNRNGGGAPGGRKSAGKPKVVEE